MKKLAVSIACAISTLLCAPVWGQEFKLWAYTTKMNAEVALAITSNFSGTSPTTNIIEQAIKIQNEPAFSLLSEEWLHDFEQTKGALPSVLKPVAVVAIAPLYVYARSGFSGEELAKAIREGSALRVGLMQGMTTGHGAMCASAFKSASAKSSAVVTVAVSLSSPNTVGGDIAKSFGANEIDVICHARRDLPLIGKPIARTSQSSNQDSEIPPLEKFGIKASIRRFFAIYGNEKSTNLNEQVIARLKQPSVKAAVMKALDDRWIFIGAAAQ